MSIGEEAIIRLIQFSLPELLLLTVFIFSARLREITDTKYSEMILSKPIKPTKLLNL